MGSIRETTYVEVYVDDIIAETDAAVLCVIEGAEHWLPRSQIEDGDQLERGYSGEILLADWIARDREIEPG